MTKASTTFMLIKPDGYMLESAITTLLNSSGICFCVYKVINPTKETILSHYNKAEEWKLKYGEKIARVRATIDGNENVSALDFKNYGDTILPAIADYMTSGPMIACLLTFSNERDERDLFRVTRELLGNIEPSEAELGTIRALARDSKFSSFLTAWKHEDRPVAIRNLAHIADSEKEAYREACLWFGTKKADIHFHNFLKKEAHEKALKENDELWRLARSVGK